MTLSKDEEIDAILRDVHRRKQIQHGIINEDGTKIERIRKRPVIISKNPKSYIGDFRKGKKQWVI